MIVAIHQPNFFPWLGFFNKIIRADIFIFMDNVQFSKTGGTWSNRVKILINGQPSWITMPIIRSYHGVRRIDEMQINNTTFWQETMLKTIKMNYARTPHFNAIFPMILNMVNNKTDSLSEYNIDAILEITKILRIDTTQFILGSTLNVEGQATDLLIDMVKAVGGTTYLCGGGAGEYQEDANFDKKGIKLMYQSFNHPAFTQVNAKTFFPGLSILDALMNCGIENTHKLISES